MKKFLATLATAAVLSASAVFPTAAFAASSEITLPSIFSKSNELSVTSALQKRKSSRNFVNENLTLAQMSKILWATSGVNRVDSKRVTPAALGVYSVEVYAVTREGIYLYDAIGHKLRLIAEGDFRSTTTTGQDFVSRAAVNLVYVENPVFWQGARRIPPRDEQISFANISVGAMVQSVALIAETEGLGNCVRASINRDEFRKAAKLSADKQILLAQSVGFVE